MLTEIGSPMLYLFTTFLVYFYKTQIQDNYVNSTFIIDDNLQIYCCLILMTLFLIWKSDIFFDQHTFIEKINLFFANKHSLLPYVYSVGFPMLSIYLIYSMKNLNYYFAIESLFGYYLLLMSWFNNKYGYTQDTFCLGSIICGFMFCVPTYFVAMLLNSKFVALITVMMYAHFISKNIRYFIVSSDISLDFIGIYTFLNSMLIYFLIDDSNIFKLGLEFDCACITYTHVIGLLPEDEKNKIINNVIPILLFPICVSDIFSETRSINMTLQALLICDLVNMLFSNNKKIRVLLFCILSLVIVRLVYFKFHS